MSKETEAKIGALIARAFENLPDGYCLDIIVQGNTIDFTLLDDAMTPCAAHSRDLPSSADPRKTQPDFRRGIRRFGRRENSGNSPF